MKRNTPILVMILIIALTLLALGFKSKPQAISQIFENPVERVFLLGNDGTTNLFVITTDETMKACVAKLGYGNVVSTELLIGCVKDANKTK